MKLTSTIVTAILVLTVPAAYAQTAPQKPTDAQIKAVRECAAKQNVQMPDPGTEPTSLTHAQIEIISNCHKQNGVPLPPPPPSSAMHQ